MMATSGLSSIDHIYNFITEEVLNTVQHYFEIKVVQEDGGTLFLFLDRRVHELFHYFIKQTPCCNTNNPCASIQRKGTLTKDQYDLLFKNDPSIQPIHETKRNGRITQYCTCPVAPNRATDVTNLDFTLINCLMKTCRKTPAGHPQWLQDIINVRNNICHLGDTSSISNQQLEEWWNKLENATVNIAGVIGVACQKGVIRRIEKIKNSQSQIQELMKNFQAKYDEFEHKIMNALQNMGVRVGDVPFLITSTEIVNEAPMLLSDNDSKKCIVIWKFRNPGDWDIPKMQEKLELLKKLGDFDIQFVYQGSIVVYTTIESSDVSDGSLFKDSIEEFLFLFVKLLQIQAPKADKLSLKLEIVLNRLETEEKECHREAVTRSINEETQIRADLPAEEDEYYGTVSGSVKEDKQTSSVLSLDEEECHRETVTRSIKEETQIRVDLPAEEDEYYGTVSGSVKEDKQTSSVLSLDEEECHRETVTRSIKEETQIRVDLPAEEDEYYGTVSCSVKEDKQTSSVLSLEEEECHRETVIRSIKEETQIRADLSAEDGEIYTETVTESVENETQTSLAVSTKEDECRRKTVTKLLEEDDQTSSTITKEEDDSQKETVTETITEETQTTSALPSEDTTHAQAPVNKSQLPRELKQIKQIDMSGDFCDCTAVDDKFVICDNEKKRLVITDSDGSNVRDIPLSGMPYWITAMDNTTVAVNIGDSDINIINIYSGQCIRRISINGFVHGLKYSEPHLYLGVSGKGKQVIDLHGNNITTIPTKRDVYFMTTNKQNIYYSDHYTVSCVTQSGERMWTVEDPMVKDIRGLTTDDTNIYVTCHYSHTVFVISPDGKQVRQLLSETDGLRYPRGICYNGKSKTLMVCNERGPAFLFNIVK